TALHTSANSQVIGENRLNARAGLLFPSLETRVRVDSERLGIGTEFRFEDDLGLSLGRTVPNFEASWRFAPSWLVGVEYFGIDRRNSASLGREIRFGEEVFDVGASVEGRFRSNLYRIQIGWLPVLSDNGHLGLMVGVHLTDFLVGVAGEVSTTAGDGSVRLAQEERDVLAPLPNIGAFGRVKIAGPVSAGGRLNWFSIRVDDLKGGITDAEAYVHWKAKKNFGVGAGYRHLDYRLDIDRSYTGRIRYRFGGPSVFLTAGF
ncbi:MAG: hypothetical protein ACK4SA_23145, partial [Caldilinea sp.]